MYAYIYVYNIYIYILIIYIYIYIYRRKGCCALISLPRVWIRRAGTQFTCFTSTNVQILTQKTLLGGFTR